MEIFLTEKILQDIPKAEHPLCSTCKHRTTYENIIVKCNAYPDGIPREILTLKEDHRNLLPGDNGIRYEPEKE